MLLVRSKPVRQLRPIESPVSVFVEPEPLVIRAEYTSHLVFFDLSVPVLVVPLQVFAYQAIDGTLQALLVILPKPFLLGLVLDELGLRHLAVADIIFLEPLLRAKQTPHLPLVEASVTVTVAILEFVCGTLRERQFLPSFAFFLPSHKEARELGLCHFLGVAILFGPFPRGGTSPRKARNFQTLLPTSDSFKEPFGLGSRIALILLGVKGGDKNDPQDEDQSPLR